MTPIPAAVTDATPLEIQVATLAAIATQAASTPVPVSSAADAPVGVVPVPQPAQPLIVQEEPVGTAEAIEPSTDSDTGSDEAPASGENAGDASVRVAAATTSNNEYHLIPLEGARDERPADEHGDLNLKLRGIQKIDSPKGAKLIDLAGSTDANAPNLAAVFNPEFVAEYTVKNWDWGCNCPTDWLEQVALIGVKTNPGDPVYIPPVSYDIFQGKYRAVLLYASEDAVTFAYSRDGTVAFSYAIHYVGLQTDPNLLALFRSSQGNELPGLTLETPVGLASEELIIGVRDKGAFMDVRSRKDWWR